MQIILLENILNLKYKIKIPVKNGEKFPFEKT